MHPHPLTLRIVFLSWFEALLAWPVALVCLNVFQGLGVLYCGGAWIGVSLPFGAPPWALVNEPSIAFSSSQSALWCYWLAQPIGAFLLVLGLVFLLPMPSTWPSHLFSIQLALALCTLGLAWFPGLGVQDHTLAGLEVFFKVKELLYLIVCAGLSFISAMFTITRLGSYLWLAPGGPLRVRRVLLAVLHYLVPVCLLPFISLVQGWSLKPIALVMLVAPIIGALGGAWVFSPRANLRPEPGLSDKRMFVHLLLGLAAFCLAFWCGLPGAGSGKALLWLEPGLTNNLRPKMKVFWVTPHLFRKTPPVSSEPRS